MELATDINTEQAENCWDEFLRDEIHYSNKLEHMGYEAVFNAGFMAAKRNMPVIELPKPIQSDGFKYWHEMDIAHALDNSGISYTIKGK
jgi:hypothetical protein